MNVTQEFDAVMTSNSYRYFFDFWFYVGGAVREHGLIKHDMDLDTAMWYEDYNDKFLLS